MIICSKCGKECGAKIESRSANPIYSDSVAVSSCCGADRIYDEGYSLDEDGLQGCGADVTWIEAEDKAEIDAAFLGNNYSMRVSEEAYKEVRRNREGWINIDVYNLPSNLLGEGKEFMVYNALYHQWEETDEDICDLLKQLRSKRILLKYRDKL